MIWRPETRSRRIPFAIRVRSLTLLRFHLRLGAIERIHALDSWLRQVNAPLDRVTLRPRNGVRHYKQIRKRAPVFLEQSHRSRGRRISNASMRRSNIRPATATGEQE